MIHYPSPIRKLAKTAALLCLWWGVLSCSPKVVPVETKIEYNYIDSLRVRDSIVIVPQERVVDIVPAYDTLTLEIEAAKSRAWVDTNLHMLRGDIESKEAVKYKYVEKERLVYRDSLVTQEIPVPVEVEKKVIPKLFWWLLGWFLLTLLAGFAYIYLKIKHIL